MGGAVTLDLVPSEEELLLREAVGGIAKRYGASYMKRCREEDRPPVELWDELGAAGFLGVNVPTEYGGGGLGMTGLAWVAEELGHHAITLALLVVSPAIAGQILARHGSPEQRERWLPGIAAATTKLAFAVTEADAGSNTHRISTSVTPTADGSWLLNGQKSFISGVEHSDGILVVARARQESGELGLPVLVIVDSDTPGLSRQPIPTTVPWAEWQWTLYFDDVEVGADRLVGGAAGGLAAVFDGLNPERIMAAAGSVGAARLAIDRAVEYAKGRSVFDAPIGTHQAIAHPLAECWIDYEAARVLTQRACALYDANDPRAGEACNMAKLAASDVAVRAADRAIQTHGGNGMTEEYGLTDLWLSARLSQIAPVSREMVLNHVAQHTLGLPRSY
jgi:alkylation response protein AidB-like acyl-CoA dehydrogenase